MLAGPWLEPRGKNDDWGQSPVAGGLFPAPPFGMPLLWRWRGWSAASEVAVKRLLVRGCLGVFVVFRRASAEKYGPRNHVLPAVLALAPVVLTEEVVPWPPWRRERIDPARPIAVFVVPIAWTAAWSLWLMILTDPPIFATGFAAAFVLVGTAAGPTGSSSCPVGAEGGDQPPGAWVVSADPFPEGAWFLSWILRQEGRLLAERRRLPLGTSLLAVARRAVGGERAA